MSKHIAVMGAGQVGLAGFGNTVVGVGVDINPAIVERLNGFDVVVAKSIVPVGTNRPANFGRLRFAYVFPTERSGRCR